MYVYQSRVPILHELLLCGHNLIHFKENPKSYHIHIIYIHTYMSLRKILKEGI